MKAISPSGCRIAIKATPNAPRNEVVGWFGEALNVKVHAPPLEGRANDGLCEFLAGVLNIPRRGVHLVSGDKSRQKVLQIDGLSLDQVKLRLPER